MSVIPFILDGNNKTVVNQKDEYDKAGGLEGNVIFIQNLDTSQIRDTESSNASYDLRVGDEYRDHRDSGKADLLDNGKIYLQPGSAVIIETAEEFQFPKSRFGHVVPKVSLLQYGLSNTSSKVDPGYYGRLSITVFNLGKRTIELKKHQPFCTLYILDVGEGSIPYAKPSKKIAGKSQTGLLNQVRDFIDTNQTTFTIILLILSSLQIILTIVSQMSSFIRDQTIQTYPKENTEKTQ
jgi:deoxycytidine triphosphate deaminase